MIGYIGRIGTIDGAAVARPMIVDPPRHGHGSRCTSSSPRMSTAEAATRIR
jgi:hypothetical protein